MESILDFLFRISFLCNFLGIQLWFFYLKILEWTTKFIQYSKDELYVGKDKNQVHCPMLNSTLIFLDLRFCYHLLNASSVYCNFTYMTLGKYLEFDLKWTKNIFLRSDLLHNNRQSYSTLAWFVYCLIFLDISHYL